MQFYQGDLVCSVIQLGDIGCAGYQKTLNVYAQNYMTAFKYYCNSHPSIYLVARGYYLHSQAVNTYQKISQQKALTNCSFQQRGIFQKHLCWSLARFNYVVLVFHVDVTQTVAVYLDLIRTVRQSATSYTKYKQ